MNILTNLKNNYLRPLFQKYNHQWEDITIRVQLPPEIPAQENGHDCGVFLLMFAKCLLLKLNFDFATEDMIHIRDDIREEMNSKQVCRDILHGRSTKRKGTRNHASIQKKTKLEKIKCPQRRIINPDAQTCWLNSCLQLVLTAMDFKETLNPIGSYLWENLVWLQGKHSSVALDPTDIKNAIILTERERMVRENIGPANALFDLGNLPILYNEDFQTEGIGQQDCRDFFICIDENREAWPDVFNLFKVKTQSETECCSCGHISRQEVGVNDRTLIFLTCPTVQVNIKDYLENQLNGSQVRDGWRDEDGCGNVVTGKSRTRISKLEETDYIIIMLERLIRVENQLHIVDTKVDVNPEEEIHLIDMEGKVGKFLPLTIIHHSGGVVEQTTQGHYRADVENKETGKWFRTSDNEPPRELPASSLTKMGYIFLLKKSGNLSTEDNVQDKDQEKNESIPFYEILKLLDEMDLDLVFHDFKKLASLEAQWIVRILDNMLGVDKFIDKLGKRMLNYSTRVSLEVIFLLTDLINQTQPSNKPSLAIMLVNDNILDALSFILNTTCHVTIRSVLNFVYSVAENLANGWAKVTLSMKLFKKISWIADQKSSLNYLTSPAISSDDKIIQNKLGGDQNDLSGTHKLAKKIVLLFK